MFALTTAIFGVWIVFWVYWLISAATAKPGTRNASGSVPRLIVVAAFVLLRVLTPHTLAVHSLVLQVVGTILFVAGLGLAVWARIYLGRNWGMPMSHKDEPELVTSGPYHFVRHPIYSGILLAILGTALATNIEWLIVFVALGAYFVYSATREEMIMMTSFPATYESYRARTKMLVPFVL